MSRSLVWLSLALACTSGPAQQAPVGERVQADVIGRWVPPPIQCPARSTALTTEEDGLVTQACMRSTEAAGPFVQWYPSGQKAAEGLFKRGHRAGQWVWWHPDGRLATRGRYDAGSEAGEWTWWHPNGKTEQRGAYLDGARVGEWSQWFDDGQLRARGLYERGHKDGTWRYWLADGTPEREEIWKLQKVREHIELEGGQRLREEREEREKAERALERSE